ncbi:hypothetical protein [Legionella londiniensis]|nr:hypothetical protein [Legionella londiniensis]
MLLLIILGVVFIAIGYYFWESFLYVHYLGGFDAYGLPVQLSYPGFSFFFYSWPLWGFPLLLALMIGVFLYLHLKIKDFEAIQEIKAKLEAQKNEMESLSLMHKARKNEMDVRLKNKYEQLQNEFTSLQSEYQRSLDFIEKLLEQMADGEKKEK